jgi:hypothetical protein
MDSASQSLAGRAALFHLPPFTMTELSSTERSQETDKLMYTGFYPGVIADGIPPYIFYQNYFNTYIERDVRNLLRVKNLERFNIFVRLLAGRTGAEFNASSLATEVGVSSTTIAEWLSILEAAYIIFPLRPFSSNISKRLTKMPKIFFYDTGLLTFLLGIEKSEQIALHPLRGAIFENLIIAEFMKRRMNEAKEPNLNFYREQSGREVDLLLSAPDGISAYEIKSARTYRTEFETNLTYLQNKMKATPFTTTVVYDGETIGNKIINFRDL